MCRPRFYYAVLPVLAATVSACSMHASSAPAPPCTSPAAAAAIRTSPALTSVAPTLSLGGGVDDVLCHDFTRDGRVDMAVTVFSGGTAGDTVWVVFRDVGGRWRLALKQLHVYKVGVFRVGNDLVDSQPVNLDGDPNCCPTGGFNHRRFHWNGTRFAVIRSWHTSKPGP